MGLHQGTRLAKKEPCNSLEPGITPRQGFAEAAKRLRKEGGNENNSKVIGRVCEMTLEIYALDVIASAAEVDSSKVCTLRSPDCRRALTPLKSQGPRLGKP